VEAVVLETVSREELDLAVGALEKLAEQAHEMDQQWQTVEAPAVVLCRSIDHRSVVGQTDRWNRQTATAGLMFPKDG